MNAACKAKSSPAPGVTATTIKLGLVAALTGPLPGQFGARNMSVATKTFRIEAEAIVDERVVARLTAIVQKKLEGDPPTVPVLEWSGLQ